MAAIQEHLILQDQFSSTFSRYITLAESGTASTKELKAAIGDAGRASRAFTIASRAAAAQHSINAAESRARAAATAELAAKERLAAQRAREAERAARSQNDAFSGLTGTLKSVAGAFLGIQGAKALVSMSDQASAIDARLKMMTGSAEEAAKAQDEIYKAAMRSRGVYTDMASLVGQLGTVAGSTFNNTKELIAFAEQLQKQMALSGTSGASASAAIVQLTQGLASGTLRGDELNSVLEQTPMIAKTIADYMGLSVGQLRKVAADGQITADVVKNAMFSAAAETDAAFAQMPMTWSQVWAQMQTISTRALDPVLKGISWAANNLDVVAPAAAAAATGLAVYTAAVHAKTIAEKLSALASWEMASKLLLSPWTWVAVGAAAAAGALVVFVQKAGGVRVAWLMTVDAFKSGWDDLKISATKFSFSAQNTMDKVGLGVAAFSYGVVDYFGEMKVGALEQIQNMANGSIDIINTMIGVVNKLPGVAIDPIEQLTFAAGQRAEHEAAKAGRAAQLAGAKSWAEKETLKRAEQLKQMQRGADLAHRYRQNEINAQKAAAAGATTTDFSFDVPDYEGVLGDISGDVSSIKKSVSLADEDIRSLVDVATRQYVNKINLTSQTPVITVNGQNTGRTAEDRKALAEAIAAVLAEQLAAGSFKTIARVF